MTAKEQIGAFTFIWKKCTKNFFRNLCSAGIVFEHSKELWRDKNGEFIEIEEQPIFYRVNNELLIPDHLNIVNKIGSNTTQSKDGQVGGQAYLSVVDG